MIDIPLSEDLQHLRNIIANAKKNVAVDLLRNELKNVADEATTADIIRIAETILQLGIDKERSQWATRN